jgi:hypothetical protein
LVGLVESVSRHGFREGSARSVRVTLESSDVLQDVWQQVRGGRRCVRGAGMRGFCP